jgi:hypothetical protein
MCCHLSLQVVMVVQFCSSSMTNHSSLISVKIAANCLAYMNSCVNPILYAFLSEPFRKSFRRLFVCRLWCRSSWSSSPTAVTTAGGNGQNAADAGGGVPLLAATKSTAGGFHSRVAPPAAATAAAAGAVNGCGRTANSHSGVADKTKFLPLPVTCPDDNDDDGCDNERPPEYGQLLSQKSEDETKV